MKEKCSPGNLEFNRILKEADHIYTRYAASMDISMTSLCVLYSIYTSQTPCTQKTLCDDWDMPKQTINSCLKQLERGGYVQMEFGEGNRKNKQIRFTAQGEALADRAVAPLIHAENAAMQALDEKEQELFLELNRKRNALLQKFLLQ